MGRHRAPDPEEDEPTGEASDDFSEPESEPEPQPEDVGDVGGYPEPDDFASPETSGSGGIRVPPYADRRPGDYPAEFPGDSGFAGFGDYPEHDEHQQADPHPDEGAAADDFPDFPRRSQETPAGPPGGGHRGGSEWTGGHRSDGGRRGVSIGVIAALVAVVVVVA